INPGNYMFVPYTKNTCNLRDMKIANLDYPALDRFHRFIRVTRKQKNWSMAALDRLIRATNLGKGLLDDKCLVLMDQLNKLQGQLSQLTLDQLVACFDVIPTVGGDNSAYSLLFLNATAVGKPNPDLTPSNVHLNEEKEQTNPVSGAPMSKYAPYLALCLGLSVPG